MGLTQKLGLLAQSVQQDASLNIGIGGAANASYKLAVTGASLFSSSINSGQIQATASGAVIQLIGQVGSNAYYVNDQINNSGKRWRFGHTGAVSGYNSFDFYNQTDDRLVMTLASGGNVGIGTSSPDRKLTIGGTTSAYMNFNATTYRNYVIGSDDVGFIVYDNFNSAYRMVINSSGNVGIGLTNPTNTFVVKPSGATNSIVIGSIAATPTYGMISFNGTNLEGQYVGLAGGGGVDVSLYYQSGNGGEHIFRTGNGTTFTERMRITSGGDVTIGSATVGARLTTWGAGTGTSTFSFVAYNASGFGVLACRDDWRVSLASLGTGTVYSNGGALTNTNPSDLRLKTNVESVEYGLNEILQLNPVTYDLKEDKLNQGKQYGFIAQEVQEVMPDLVKPLQFEEDLLGLDKEAIYTILVKAIQELSAKVTALENK